MFDLRELEQAHEIVGSAVLAGATVQMPAAHTVLTQSPEARQD